MTSPVDPLVLYFVYFVDFGYRQSARVDSDVSQCAEDEQNCKAFQEQGLHETPRVLHLYVHIYTCGWRFAHLATMVYVYKHVAGLQILLLDKAHATLLFEARQGQARRHVCMRVYIPIPALASTYLVSC